MSHNCNRQANQHHRILIIGSGVIGLTTAYLLLEKGYGVTVISKEFPSTRHLPRIASDASGAMCVPPELMSRHPAFAQEDIAKLLKRWATYGLEMYTSLTGDSKTTGVYLKEVVVLFEEKLDPAALEQYKGMRGFRNSLSIVREKGLSVPSGRLKDVVSFFGPIIDSPKFGTWLMQECIKKGGQIIQGAIRGLISEQAEALKATYGVQFIVNCSGLGSMELVADKEMFPARGGLLKAKNDGTRFPKIDFCVEGLWTSFGEDEAGQPVVGCTYVFPRGEDHLLLGSFVQANSGDRHVTMSSPYVQSMLKQCKELCPRLQALNDSDFQLTVGIRPGREKVRLEQDPDEPCIFHNYGHYRWGMTLNWGSAADIVKLIDREVTKTSRRTTKNRLGLAKL